MSVEVQIPLADAIRALRAEIASAQRLAQGEAVRFGLGTVELEFQVVVTRDAGGTGAINFGVVSFGATGKVASAETHKVKISLTPLNASGDATVYVGDRVGERPG
jgi:hypothetical protein